MTPDAAVPLAAGRVARNEDLGNLALAKGFGQDFNVPVVEPSPIGRAGRQRPRLYLTQRSDPTVPMALPKDDNASPGGTSLYERDFYAWALEQERALSERRADDLDWINLTDEVGGLARSERRTLRSLSAKVIEELLKLAFAPSATAEKDRRLWRLSLVQARWEIGAILDDSPSLKSSVADLFAKAWLIGRAEALKFLDLDDDAIPESLLWSF